MANRICELLRCTVPIQLAPMGSVSATPTLPLAVAAAGGHGMYPALGLPPPALAPIVDALAAGTDAFGVNFIVPVMDRDSLDVALERAPYVDFFLADPDATLLAAGGIATARGVAAAFAAGADGVRIGTRFIASTESDAHPAWVEAVIDAGPEDSVVSHAFNVGLPEPGPHRVLRSSIEAAEALTDGEVGVVRLAGAEIPVARFAAQPPMRESTGTIEAMPFYAGQSAGAIHTVQPAAEIVAELAQGVPAVG